MDFWNGKPDAGPFKAVIYPLIQLGFGVLAFAVLVVCSWQAIKSIMKWVSARSKKSSYQMETAEEELLPPVIGIVLVLIAWPVLTLVFNAAVQ
jgi:hypothetical protein